jgi:hypothetical protein
MTPYEYDEEIEKSIERWFGDDSNKRKEVLRGKEFHIDNNLGL